MAREEVGDSGTHYFAFTSKENFRHMYYAAIEITTECVCIRFNQKDLMVYQSINKLSLTAVADDDHDEELEKVMAVYGDSWPCFQKCYRQWGTTPTDSTPLI